MEILDSRFVSRAANLNEMEIRFHIIDRVLRKLGYPDEQNTYLYLEEKLEYPYLHIGRRSKKDLPLGFPDYRAGVEGARGSFIVEAKSGSVAITKTEIEQAHSYAAHAQVGANYFVLCNGSEILVFETLSGANHSPILRLEIDEVDSRFHELENILSPASLIKNCRVTYDTKLKLADGLGSSLKVLSGAYSLSTYELRCIMNGQDCTDIIRRSDPQFTQIESQIEMFKTTFQMRVSKGTAERADDGRIVADVEFEGVTIPNKQAMELMGIDRARFVTSDKFLSTDPSNPTIFETERHYAVSRGTSVPQMLGGNTATEAEVQGNLFIKVGMSYSDCKITGEYIAFSEQELSFPGLPPLILELEMAGNFEMDVIEN